MIKEVNEKDIVECVKIIRESFFTVANEFGFTAENAPRFTAFATTEDRLKWHLLGEHRPMYAYYDKGAIVGYYSLLLQDNNECELNNLCVIPAYRHKGIGEELLMDAFKVAKESGCVKVNIGIVEENQVLRKWYEKFGFIHVGTQKFDFFPFTCGYMEKNL
ncbi:MAG: GNAT family N-acetyltransferase [Lachnospiraceae bacterium]|nr:GNAT family N-acetyltransferase [Lachnospiraceae bacterium]